MTNSTEHHILRIMSGQQRGLTAFLLRTTLAAIEPLYKTIIALRNKKFDARIGVKKLPRPVISVGNLTAGGTGKTPVVRWLCQRLRAAGLRPAILLRGYKSHAGLSDEQRMLETTLNESAQPPVIVHANPNRFAGGAHVLKDHPDVDLFILDDGFQHRRLARDFDLVLISATDPWGFDHLHPRGLLREPLRSLARARAILITHADEVDAATLTQIENRIRRHTPVPIYHASHHQTGFRSPASPATLHPVTELAGKPIYTFCGIANPSAFFNQLQSTGAKLIGHSAYPDHYQYLPTDLTAIDSAAQAAGAAAILTTEKDWARLALMPRAHQTKTPICRVDLTIRFRPDDESQLLSSVLVHCQAHHEASAPPPRNSHLHV